MNRSTCNSVSCLPFSPRKEDKLIGLVLMLKGLGPIMLQKTGSLFSTFYFHKKTCHNSVTCAAENSLTLNSQHLEESLTCTLFVAGMVILLFYFDIMHQMSMTSTTIALHSLAPFYTNRPLLPSRGLLPQGTKTSNSYTACSLPPAQLSNSLCNHLHQCVPYMVLLACCLNRY